MSAIATIHRHERDDTILVIRTPPADNGDLMAGFEAATYSPASRGYLVGAGMLDHLRRWLTRHDVHVVDERGTERRAESRLNPAGSAHSCAEHGCKTRAVTFGQWAADHPEDARELCDSLDAIRARVLARKTTPAEGGASHGRQPTRTAAS